MKKIALPSFLDPTKPFLAGTVPLKGEDKSVYSEGHVVQMFSYLWTHYSQEIDEKYHKFIPTAPSPTYLTYEGLIERINQETNLNGWELCEDGALKFTNKEILEKQSGVLLQMFGKAIKSLMYSNMVGMSLPARIFDSISMLESITYSSRYAPAFLSKAARMSDPFERFKLYAAGSIALCHLTIRAATPLNPVIGETFQIGLEDGTSVYAEQTSHHPPVANVLYYGPSGSYKMYGKLHVEGKMSMNTMTFYSLSSFSTAFKDGQIIESNGFPTIKMTGLTIGERHLIMKNSLEFIDKKHGWKCVIFFDYGEKKGIISSKKTVPKDWIEGIIYIPINRDFSLVGKTKNPPKCIEDLKDVKTELARIKGSWLQKVEINAVNYWIMDKVKPAQYFYANNPLPSDSRFREDVVWLRRGKVEYADKWKDAIEIRQRQDQKLRDDYKKKK